jgi:hypothetical protein
VISFRFELIVDLFSNFIGIVMSPIEGSARELMFSVLLCVVGYVFSQTYS